MPDKADTSISVLIKTHRDVLLVAWQDCQRREATSLSSKLSTAELSDQSSRFLAALDKGAQSGRLDDVEDAAWDEMREVLEEVSTARVAAGFTPSETAIFVFSFKEPLFNLLRRETKDAEALGREIWQATRLLDRLGLYAVELYQKAREEVIMRQQQELLELSTPVVQLAEGILALPLIGTLDSARTQIVMESLLEQIVAAGAEIAIIDITGVPTVDTLVAQHLIKTVSAARLMGADCIISGIRPQIAQTIVHLGLDLDVVSKATMADAFMLALRRSGRAIVAKSARTDDKA
ncbi:MAG TPA: STAS domain-containing protein [Aliidongia sp.]|nr:STAS domain-containing protein [Aliidongia sp.]